MTRSAITTNRGAEPVSVRNAVKAMYVGLGLSMVAVLAVVIDQAAGNGLPDALKTAYRNYDPEKLSTTQSSILTYLFAVGVLGAVCWLVLAQASRKGKGWARVGATVVFVIATFLALYDFTQHFPLTIALAGLLPCIAGVAAVVLLWRRDSSAYFGKSHAGQY